MSKYYQQYKNSLISGFFIWIIPFLISFLFYSKDGLSINIFSFKSIMIISGALTGSLLLIWYFKETDSSFFISGIIFGAVVLLVSWMLDLLVLCYLFGEDPVAWFTAVGVRYLSIPAMSISAGYIADSAVKNSLK